MYGNKSVTICVWTLGLRFAGKLTLAPENREALVREALRCVAPIRPVPADWPAALLVSGGYASPQDPTVAIDTRPFKDPAKGNSGRHVGFHACVLDGLVQSRCQDFSVFFKEQVWAPILEAVAAAPGHAPHTVHVLSFCTSGRHRSVGIASLIWEVAHQTTQWDLKMDHLSAGEWWHGTCSGCQECHSRQDRRKANAFAAALAAAAKARQTFDARRLAARG